jgi:hypothetical protein
LNRKKSINDNIVFKILQNQIKQKKKNEIIFKFYFLQKMKKKKTIKKKKMIYNTKLMFNSLVIKKIILTF